MQEVLSGHPKIEKVYWPGLESHANHAIAKEQMNDFGGMISFVTKGNDYNEAIKIVENLKIFTLAESLGGVESLISLPYNTSQASLTKQQQKAIGINDGLIRLSVGVEDIEDLISDFEQALQSIFKTQPSYA